MTSAIVNKIKISQCGSSGVSHNCCVVKTAFDTADRFGCPVLDLVFRELHGRCLPPTACPAHAQPAIVGAALLQGGFT